MSTESSTVKETTEYSDGTTIETTTETTINSDNVSEEVAEVIAEEIGTTGAVIEPVVEASVTIAEIEANKEITIAAIQAETTVELAELRKEGDETWLQNSETVQEMRARILSLETSLAQLTAPLIPPASEEQASPPNNPESVEVDLPDQIAPEVAQEPAPKAKRKWRLI